LVKVREYLLLKLEGAVGHIVSPKMNLELIPVDSLDVGVGVVVSAPPVCYCSKHLVCREKNLLTIGTLGYLQFLLN
jgi:hypothetical protein